MIEVGLWYKNIFRGMDKKNFDYMFFFGENKFFFYKFFDFLRIWVGGL